MMLEMSVSDVCWLSRKGGVDTVSVPMASSNELRA